jgi:hypothetical protein
MAYISVFTRPYISLTYSSLSRYLTSPGEQQLCAAVHAWRFLTKTHDCVLKASAITIDNTAYSVPGLVPNTKNPERVPIFFGSFYVSFANNPLSRVSSDGYFFKLFEMLINWKAMKQQSVTKSTTKAELYALSHAASELIW